MIDCSAAFLPMTHLDVNRRFSARRSPIGGYRVYRTASYNVWYRLKTEPI